MNKTVTCLPLVAALLSTPLAAARADIAVSDSSCDRGMNLKFCGTDRGHVLAVAGAAVAGTTVLVLSANHGPAEPNPFCPLPTTTTPEPATIALVATGMLALVSKRVARKRRANASI